MVMVKKLREKVGRGTEPETFTGWFFLEAFALLKDEQAKEIIGGRNKADVKIMIDGHEVPFNKLMKTLGECISKTIEKRAKEMLEAKTTGKIVDIANMMQDIEWKVEEEIEKVFPKEE